MRCASSPGSARDAAQLATDVRDAGHGGDKSLTGAVLALARASRRMNPSPTFVSDKLLSLPSHTFIVRGRQHGFVGQLIWYVGRYDSMASEPRLTVCLPACPASTIAHVAGYSIGANVCAISSINTEERSLCPELVEGL